MTIHVEVFPRGLGKRPEAEISKIASWHRELFSGDQDIIDAFSWQDKSDLGFEVCTYTDKELVGFAHVFLRLARVDDAAALTGCLGTVMTARAHQRTGIGSITVKAAGEIILKSMRAELGVLLCKPALTPFYARLGWRRMTSPVVIEQPRGKMTWPHEAMVLSRVSESALPQQLDLCGLPF